MATQTPLNIKSSARKLPIKRKHPPTQPNPNPNPNPNPLSSHLPSSSDPESEPENNNNNPTKQQPPFKFHRIWPESDEIRFLQGLLGCFSQNLLFPRDLNIFYDRFSESMSQPYTRSQLSEKLRRLRKKYRTMAGRIARGQDPSRLSQHDRDLLHLSTRLWDASNSSTSPFSAPEEHNKRRRPNPRAAAAAQVVVALESASVPLIEGIVKVEKKGVECEKRNSENVVIESVLDVLDGVLNEARARIVSSVGGGEKGLERRWQENRLAELDLLSRRWRLVIEHKGMQI